MDGDGSTGARLGLIADISAPVAGRAAAAGLSRWLARAAPARTHGRVSIALVSDAAMRRLNREYRGVDRATDVLSFPSHETYLRRGLTFVGRAGFGRANRNELKPATPEATFLGDIAIAAGVARRQARAHGHPLRTELRTLALHGLLHLLGYDHATDRGEMRRLEERLRARAGLGSGLIARTGVRRR